MSKTKTLSARLTDEEVEREIARLRKSPLVELSQKEYAIRTKRRQYLYTLRWHEKNGRRLQEMGWTPDMAEDEEPIDCL
jgi:hypothetical protein